MSTGNLKSYGSYAVDYSVIREFGGTTTFKELLDIFGDGSHDVYVDRSFKLMHYCVIHQADDKDNAASVAVRDLISILLPLKKFHEVKTVACSDFVAQVGANASICFVMTKNSLTFKRLHSMKFEGVLSAFCIISTDGVKLYSTIDECLADNPLPQPSHLASKTEYLVAPIYCSVGDTVLTGNGEPVVLGNRISNGAEGMVFKTDNPKVVAKIYHKGVITPLRWAKLTKMVSIGIKSVGICWPLNLLFCKGVPVGYTMSFGKGVTLGNVFDGPDAITNAFPNWKREDVASTAINLIEKYIYLHMHDIIAGDIQLKNALLFSSNTVYLIDMDSIQIGNFPCPVGTEEFTSPALWGNNFSDFLRTPLDEDYSIAMLSFSVLFCGLHPYARRFGKETLREEIIDKSFVYKLDNSNTDSIPLGGYNYIWEYLSDKLKNMFLDVFAYGKSYEAIQWLEALIEYRDMLVGKKFADEEAYKVFPKMNYHVTVQKEVKPAETFSRSVGNNYKINTSDFKSSSGKSSTAPVTNSSLAKPSFSGSSYKGNSNNSSSISHNPDEYIKKHNLDEKSFIASWIKSRETRIIILFLLIAVVVIVSIGLLM